MESANRSRCSEALTNKRRAIRERNAAKRKNKIEPAAIFPPLPPSKILRHNIITGMCEDVMPNVIEESGCGVCGKLT
ncbi:hypothetical protein C8R44DRAFT_649163, partial [Mycena epipterygia]